MPTATLELRADSRQVRTATGDLRSLEGQGRNTESTVLTLRNAFVALGGTLAAQRIVQYADSYKSIQNQLRIVTKTSEELLDVQGKLLNVANSTRSEVEATSGLYATLARNTTELNLSQDRLVRITDIINKSFAASGASAQEASGAIRQLSQGLAAGALRGDEFNSVAEGAPEILRAVSAETGKTIGQLREFAATGGITAELLIRSLESYGDTIDEIFDKSERTFGQSLTVANNNITDFVGNVESGAGVIGILGDAAVSLSENLGALSTVGQVVATLYGAKLVSAFAASTAAKVTEIATTIKQSQTTATAAAAEANYLRTVQASLVAQLRSSTVTAQQASLRKQLSINTVALTAAQARANTAMTAGTIAARGLSSAMAFVGGPVGVAVLAAAALVAYADSSDEAKEKTIELNTEVSKLVSSYENLNTVGKKLAVTKLNEEMEGYRKEIIATQKEIDRLKEEQSTSTSTNQFSGISQAVEISQLEGEVKDLEGSLDAASKKLGALFDAGMPKKWNELADGSEKTGSATDELNEEFDKVAQKIKDEIFLLEEGQQKYDVMIASRRAGVDTMSEEGRALADLIDKRRQLTEEEQTKNAFSSLQTTLGSEGQTELDKIKTELENRLRIIQEFDDLNAENDAEAKQAALDAEQVYQDKKTEITKAAADERQQAEQNASNMQLQQQQATLSAFGNFFGTVASIAKEGGEESFEAYKVLASAQAGISAALAILQVYGDPLVPTFLKFPLSAAIGGLAAVQVAQINSAEYSGARRQGGQVLAGNDYLVGESGPEVVSMGGRGRVTPFNQLMQSTNNTNNENKTTNANITFQMPEGNEDFRNRVAQNRDLIYNVVAQVMDDRGQRLGGRR